MNVFFMLHVLTFEITTIQYSAAEKESVKRFSTPFIEHEQAKTISRNFIISKDFCSSAQSFTYLQCCRCVNISKSNNFNNYKRLYFDYTDTQILNFANGYLHGCSLSFRSLKRYMFQAKMG